MQSQHLTSAPKNKIGQENPTHSKKHVNQNCHQSGQSHQQSAIFTKLRASACCEASFDKSRPTSQVHNLRRLRVVIPETALSAARSSCEDRHGIFEALGASWSCAAW
jgi:hypothetical protein